ncbi:MAG: YdcF family protein [Floccifex sp.]
MISIGTIITILCVLPFIMCMTMERRSLWSGITFFLFLGYVAGISLLLLIKYMYWLSQYPILYYGIILIGLFAIILLFLLPIIVLIVYFVEGIQILRKEGFRPTNLLSLLFAIGIFVLIFIWPLSHASNRFVFLFLVVEEITFYFLIAMTIYVVSGLLNLFHLSKHKKLQYIVVLGSGILGTKVTPLLASRIDKGIELYNKNPNSILIFSGGQGPGEDIPEAQAMANYAYEKGIDPSRILLENQSRNTHENLLFSFALMDNPKKVAIVSTSYHVFRALILAKKENLKCIGFGSKTKWYFTFNALIREFIGYLSVEWKFHSVILGIITGLTIFLGLLN